MKMILRIAVIAATLAMAGMAGVRSASAHPTSCDSGALGRLFAQGTGVCQVAP